MTKFVANIAAASAALALLTASGASAAPTMRATHEKPSYCTFDKDASETVPKIKFHCDDFCKFEGPSSTNPNLYPICFQTCTTALKQECENLVIMSDFNLAPGANVAADPPQLNTIGNGAIGAGPSLISAPQPASSGVAAATRAGSSCNQAELNKCLAIPQPSGHDRSWNAHCWRTYGQGCKDYDAAVGGLTIRQADSSLLVGEQTPPQASSGFGSCNPAELRKCRNIPQPSEKVEAWKAHCWRKWGGKGCEEYDAGEGSLIKTDSSLLSLAPPQAQSSGVVAAGVSANNNNCNPAEEKKCLSMCPKNRNADACMMQCFVMYGQCGGQEYDAAVGGLIKAASAEVNTHVDSVAVRGAEITTCNRFALAQCNDACNKDIANPPYTYRDVKICVHACGLKYGQCDGKDQGSEYDAAVGGLVQ